MMTFFDFLFLAMFGGAAMTALVMWVLWLTHRPARCRHCGSRKHDAALCPISFLNR